MTRKPALLLTIILMGAAAPDLAAQRAEEAELTGDVISATTGEPIPGAFIGLQGWEFGTFSREEGDFRLPEVPAGPRRYEVEALGYLPVETTLDATSGDQLIELEPDESLQAGLAFLFAHLENRRNGGRVFDRQDIAFSGAYDVREFLEGRGVRRLRKFCIDERHDPGAPLAPPQYFYLIEVHGRTARIYTEEFLEQIAREDEQRIREIIRLHDPIC